jgi:prepilin-type N-terminal cleavage/methylation domain-containing protein
MMRTQRRGFTLIELLIVIVVGGIVLAATVRALSVQERTYRATSELVRGQEGLRVALGVLESELREAASMGPTIGAGDILMAARDSIRFRAQRKLGFVCEILASDKTITTWSISDVDRFGDEDNPVDAVLIFRGWDVNEADRWVALKPQNEASSTAGCPANPATQLAHNRLQNLQRLDGADVAESVLNGVAPGAPVRGLQEVTYSLHSVNGDWRFGRRNVAGNVEHLAGGFAEEGVGLRLTYFDAFGNTLLGDPVNAAAVASIQVTATTAPPSGSGAHPVSMTSTIFLRNN